MALLYVKAFHIVGFVAWFAGLFYWLRIFVYFAESMAREEPARGILIDQFTRMERRVYSIIVVPGMVLTWGCGVTMLILNPGYLQQPWLLIKLGLLFLLSGFQAFAKTKIRKAEDTGILMSGEKLRLLNEVPTVFLLSIVLLAVLRNSLDALAAFTIVVTFIVGLGAGVRYYRGYRAKHPEH